MESIYFSSTDEAFFESLVSLGYILEALLFFFSSFYFLSESFFRRGFGWEDDDEELLSEIKTGYSCESPPEDSFTLFVFYLWIFWRLDFWIGLVFKIFFDFSFASNSLTKFITFWRCSSGYHVKSWGLSQPSHLIWYSSRPFLVLYHGKHCTFLRIFST